jgi:hypothetical protein
MGAGSYTEDRRALMERLARDYKLALSGAFDEQSPGSFYSDGASFETQRGQLVARIEALAPDSIYLLVLHAGTDTPELRALEDSNEEGVPGMSVQRQLERDLLLSRAFRDALRRKNVQLVTYRTLAASPE